MTPSTATATGVVHYLARQPWFVAPRLVVELGARDAQDSAVMASAWPHATVHAFECNPATLPLCHAVAVGEPRIVVHGQAVTDRNGPVTFMQIDTDRTRTSWADGNPGASSLFVADPAYPVESYAQRPITVEGTRLDDALQDVPGEIDLLWMDLQGAELLALRGLGRRLPEVRVVFTEVNIHSPYEGAAGFAAVDHHLRRAGLMPWKVMSLDYFQGDVLYVRRGLAGRRAETAARAGWARLRCTKAASEMSRATRAVRTRRGRVAAPRST